jgi:poly-gamma-glutamate synthesis protein (capsule biosynthesis protein)
MAWDHIKPDSRIINLETSVTTSNDFWRGKEIHYRMHPDNIDCLRAARIDCCTLANNHVLDWGYAGLDETLLALRRAGLKTAGAGHDRQEAEAPAIIDIFDKGRVIVLARGSASSGIPWSWCAKEHRAGVSLLQDMADRDVQDITKVVSGVMRDKDVVVASIHWGPNWGFEVPADIREFAHRLIDTAGVDLVFGHSSHHIKGIEIHQERLILYGCGDFLTDYEGISGHESFRGDLSLLYFVQLDATTGALVKLLMFPTTLRRMSVQRAGAEDVEWMQNVLNRESRPLGLDVRSVEDGWLSL